MARKQERAKAHSIKGEIQMAATPAPKPPAWSKLSQAERRRFDAIVKTRDHNAWTDIDLQHAVTLAATLVKIDQLRAEIETEGDIIDEGRGQQINPKHKLCETLVRRSVTLARAVHVHAEATTGDASHQKQRSQKQREINRIMGDQAGDNLLASRSH